MKNNNVSYGGKIFTQYTRFCADFISLICLSWPGKNQSKPELQIRYIMCVISGFYRPKVELCFFSICLTLCMPKNIFHMSALVNNLPQLVRFYSMHYFQSVCYGVKCSQANKKPLQEQSNVQQHRQDVRSTLSDNELPGLLNVKTSYCCILCS